MEMTKNNMCFSVWSSAFDCFFYAFFNRPYRGKKADMAINKLMLLLLALITLVILVVFITYLSKSGNSMIEDHIYSLIPGYESSL